jgi:hypothetical protein
MVVYNINPKTKSAKCSKLKLYMKLRNIKRLLK